MAIRLHDLARKSGTIDMRDPEVTLEGLIVATGASRYDHAAVEAFAYANVPATYDSLTDRSIGIDELGNGKYQIKVSYKVKEGQTIPGQAGNSTPQQPDKPDANDALDSSWNFKTGGGTVTIKQSLKTMESGVSPRAAALGRTAPDYKGAINVQKDRVEGCEVYVGKLEFSHTVQTPTLSLRYIRKVRDLTGCVNIKKFWDREPGELLFLGATGQTRSTQEGGGWTVTFDFVENPNQCDIEICSADSTSGAFTVPFKRGWDYLWVAYEPNDDQNKITQIPYAYYVEQVYPYEDFAYLGIGASEGEPVEDVVRRQDNVCGEWYELPADEEVTV